MWRNLGEEMVGGEGRWALGSNWGTYGEEVVGGEDT